MWPDFTRHTVTAQPSCLARVIMHTPAVPKLWEQTIEAHRREVHAAIVDATATLVAEHGLMAVTMSRIAGRTGIGRATLYKYFPDVEAVLLAWHERLIRSHLDHLAEIRNSPGDAGQRLGAVLQAYAGHAARGHHDNELSALLHRDEQVGRARQQLRGMVRELLAEGVSAGKVRSDVAPDELAGYCLHALHAAQDLSSMTAVRRLVRVTLAGLRPDAG